MLDEQTVKKMATAYLSGSSVKHLEEVITHGIHNITNEFSRVAESAEEYDLMHRVFSHEAFIMRESFR